MPNPRWERIEHLLRELEIPTEIEPFVASFGEELTQEKLTAFSMPEDNEGDLVDQIRTAATQIPTGSYIPRSFLTDSDDSLANFLQGTRKVAKATCRITKAPDDRYPADLSAELIILLIRIMELQANSPFAICSLGALATLRMIIDSFVILVSRDDLDEKTVNLLRQTLRLPIWSLDKVLRGEIGFAYLSGQGNVTKEQVQEWKESVKLMPGFRSRYYQALVRYRFPSLNSLAVTTHVENLCFCLKEYRRLRAEFPLGGYREIMVKPGIGPSLLRRLTGEGSTQAFETCFAFSKAIPHIQKWIDATLDSPSAPIRFADDLLSYSIESNNKLDSTLTLNFLPANKVFTIHRKPLPA